jgi:hypothetical protein
MPGVKLVVKREENGEEEEEEKPAAKPKKKDKAKAAAAQAASPPAAEPVREMAAEGKQAGVCGSRAGAQQKKKADILDLDAMFSSGGGTGPSDGAKLHGAHGASTLAQSQPPLPLPPARRTRTAGTTGIRSPAQTPRMHPPIPSPTPLHRRPQ